MVFWPIKKMMDLGMIGDWFEEEEILDFEIVGIKPRFKVKGTMFNCSTIEEGVKVFRTLKAQKFVPMNS